MNINVKSLFFMTMACAPLLQAASTPSNPSRVINIGSVLGIMTRAEPTPSYDASKAAVHHLTKKLAAYLAERGVTVNAIAPGLVPSKMGDQAIRFVLLFNSSRFLFPFPFLFFFFFLPSSSRHFPFLLLLSSPFVTTAFLEEKLNKETPWGELGDQMIWEGLPFIWPLERGAG